MFNQVSLKLSLVLSLLTGAASLTPMLHAQCGAQLKSVKPMSWSVEQGGAALLPAALAQDQASSSTALPSIVGMWRVTFTARTMNGQLIPNTVIDQAIVVWHEDHTEIMNSGRPPQDGNFCLGVWKQLDTFAYRLNHFAWAPNAYAPGTPDGTVGQPIGPVQYKEEVVLGPGGQHYTGAFSLDQYDTAGHVAVSFTGVLKATRITINTTAQELLQ